MYLHRRFGADGRRFYPFRCKSTTFFRIVQEYYEDFWKILGVWVGFLSAFYWFSSGVLSRKGTITLRFFFGVPSLLSLSYYLY